MAKSRVRHIFWVEVVTVWKYDVEGQDAMGLNGTSPLPYVGGQWSLPEGNYIQW